MEKISYKLSIVLFLLFVSGCGAIQTEFYREETLHLYNLGVEQYKNGEYQDAQQTFEQVVNMDPDYGPAYATMGNLAMIREDYGQAVKQYQQALQYDPELEVELLPLLLVSNQYRVRMPLKLAGVSLKEVHNLMLNDRQQDLEKLLQQNFPLELLANDTVSLTPGQLGELRRKAVQIASNQKGTARYKLFLGCLIFFSELDDLLAEKVLTTALMFAETKDQSEGYVILGRLYEKTGQLNKAVDSFLAAIAAGNSLEKVAHYLARIYKVDIATVLKTKDSTVIVEQTKPIGDQQESFLPPAVLLEKSFKIAPLMNIQPNAQPKKRKESQPGTGKDNTTITGHTLMQ